MTFKIRYERKYEGSRNWWTYATEQFYARGVMHAQKIAMDHVKEFKKVEPNAQFRIASITEI